MGYSKTQYTMVDVITENKVNKKCTYAAKLSGVNIINLLICGMNWWTTEVDLNMIIGSYGIKYIDFGMHNTNGKSKGWALLQLSDKKMTNELLEDYNRFILNGQKVHLFDVKNTLFTSLVDYHPLKNYIKDYLDTLENKKNRNIPPPPNRSWNHLMGKSRINNVKQQVINPK